MRRECKCGCGESINHKHPNAKFLNQRHKDKYWNKVNPRGLGFRHTPEGYVIKDGTAYDEFDDPVYDLDDNEKVGYFDHPFSGDAMGQD